jgi:hypothetical protein
VEARLPCYKDQIEIYLRRIKLELLIMALNLIPMIKGLHLTREKEITVWELTTAKCHS